MDDATIHALGYTTDDMMNVVKFNGRGVNVTSKFYSYVAGAYGNCFVFNYPDSSFSIRSTGPGTGLYMELNINQTDYLFGSDGSRAGVLLYVHNQLVPPTPSSGITVAPGVFNSIAIQQVNISRLEPPFGDCSADVTANNARYSVAWCFEECLLENSLKECGCKPLSYSGDHPKYFNKSVCPDGNKCVLDLTYRLNNPGSSDVSCNCPPPCAEARFNLVSSPAQWPSLTAIKKKLQALRQNVTQANIDIYSQNYLAVDIYFSDLNLQTVTQAKSLELAQFLGNVGGILGVFVGGSLMSGAEIIVFFATSSIVLYSAIKSRRHGQNVDKVSKDQGL